MQFTNLSNSAGASMLIGVGSQLFYFRNDKGCHDIDDVTTTSLTRKTTLFPLGKLDLDMLLSMKNKSLLIGARGYVTYALLKKSIDMPQIKSLGCPSLFLYRDNDLGTVLQRNRDHILKNSNNLASLKFIITLPAYVKNLITLLHNIAVTHPDSVVVAQDKRDMITLQTAATNGLHFPNVKYFMSYSSWLHFVCDFDGGIGTRIHGAMILVACGKPVFLIPPDLRVDELASAMLIPYKPPFDPYLTSNLSALDLFSLPGPSAQEVDANRAQKAKVYLHAMAQVGVVGAKHMYHIAGLPVPDCV